MGAWIETLCSAFALLVLCVAPRVGAWIETYYFQHDYNARKSHPVWVRGLKQARLDVGVTFDDVAPRVGAWIETSHRI